MKRGIPWATWAGIGTVWAGLAATGPGDVAVFLEPNRVAYRLEAPDSARLLSLNQPAWIRGVSGSGTAVDLGSRVVLRLARPQDLARFAGLTALRLDRTVTSNLFVFQARDAWAAAQEASRWAQMEGVEVSHPIRRQPARLHGAYAPGPNDRLFPEQWHLEHRDPATAERLGPDLNVRAAWPLNRGEGIIIGVGDEGIELSHPDLAANTRNSYHWSFVGKRADGTPVSASAAHGTAVAGLIAAVAGNHRGVAGVAPASQIASWVIFDRFGNLVDEEAMMDVFQYRSNVVWIQNHSWGNASAEVLPMGTLEDQGMENAVTHGRAGRGVVFVRSAGNARLAGNDVNDEGYGQDPRAIAVGAVRNTGRAASYSTPGAPVLVAAFSGDDDVDTPAGGRTNYLSLATTDRQGSLGYNADATGDNGNYGYGSTGFSGTSGSAPQISGLCALILGVNPGLTYRDVQQVLILAARPLDPADPDNQVNGAGFVVNHNVGFGVPDAGEALRLAAAWPNRPARTSASVSNRQAVDIPDDGLRVELTGISIPPELGSVPAFPSDAPHPDDPTAAVPLVDVGQALSPMTVDLRGKAALIQRGINYFSQKIQYAADAGAAFAVVSNNRDATERVFMGGGDLQFAPIPAVFIDQTSGDALRAALQADPNVQARLRLNAVSLSFNVTASLLCEHVRVRATFDHPRRADVRLTLVSPAGTRSVLHHFNQDTLSALGSWDFYSVHHFYENSAGLWRAEVSDERPGQTGRVVALELTLFGVPIEDADRDGLDDGWERRYWGDLRAGPREDPDGDGYSNIREQILGWNPRTADPAFRLDLSRWNSRLARLSWPAPGPIPFAVAGRSEIQMPWTSLTNVVGDFPETEWFVPYDQLSHSYFEVRRPQPAR